MANPLISMIAMAPYDIKAKSGDTLVGLEMEFWNDDAHTDPINLTAFTTIIMEIKSKQLDSVPKLSLSVGDGFTIGGPDNNRLIFNKRLLIKGGTYFYDIEFTDSSATVTTYIGGNLFLDQDTTKTQTEK